MELFFACLITLFAIIIIYIILVKFFISMLVATGLSRKVARFQIFSVFSSTGFTTKESELVTISSTRRKVIIAGMITNYIFSILTTSLLIGIVLNLDFSGVNGDKYITRLLVTLGISIGALILTIILTTNRTLRSVFFKLVRALVYRHSTKGENEVTFHDQIGNKYLASVKLLYVPSVLVGKRFEDVNFASVGITILAVNARDVVFSENFQEFTIEKGMELEIYGSAKSIAKIFYSK